MCVTNGWDQCGRGREREREKDGSWTEIGLKVNEWAEEKESGLFDIFWIFNSFSILQITENPFGKLKNK